MSCPATSELRRIWESGRQNISEVFALCANFESELRDVKAEVAENLGLRAFPDDLASAFDSFAGRYMAAGSAASRSHMAEADRLRKKLSNLTQSAEVAG